MKNYLFIGGFKIAQIENHIFRLARSMTKQNCNPVPFIHEWAFYLPY